MKVRAIEEDSSNPPLPHAPASPFRAPGFRRYWLSQLCAIFASQMQGVAIGWQVYDMTQRPLDLGFVGLAQFLPVCLLALAAGQVADRYDRRRIFVGCLGLEMLCALLLLVLTLMGNREVLWIFAVLVLAGVARAFQFPATAALLPNLVPTTQFASAAALTSSARQAASIIGPAVGGLLYAVGPGMVYSSCVGLLVAAALQATCIHRRGGGAARKAVTWSSVVAGVAFIRAHPIVLGAISLDLFAVLLGGATALLPIYARDILLVGPWGLGLLRSAPAIGALGMAALLARRPIRSQMGPVLFATVAVFGAATIGFALSEQLWLSIVMLAVLGASDMVSVVIRRVIVQVSTPDEMRGRVSAVESVFIGASNELGEFESGVTAAWLGVVPAAVLGGVGTLVVVLCWAQLFPQLRQVDTLAE
ncbi:MAG TPA: MFS transporter [Methylomirabilota bacterium]|jgi:MFS family permease|nr:MFS transporter [Methylomirabilota bacterium]